MHKPTYLGPPTPVRRQVRGRHDERGLVEAEGEADGALVARAAHEQVLPLEDLLACCRSRGLVVETGQWIDFRPHVGRPGMMGWMVQGSHPSTPPTGPSTTRNRQPTNNAPPALGTAVISKWPARTSRERA